MTNTAKIVAFIRARLDDDERLARAAVAGPWAVHGNGEVYAPGFDRQVRYDTGRSTTDHLFVTSDSEGLSASVQPEDAAHIARWNPARVLAEVESKRRTIECCVETLAGEDRWDPQLDGGTSEPFDLARAVLQLMAMAYAAYPDFDPAWCL